MKKKLIIPIGIVIVISILVFASSILAKDTKNNGQPFQELWNALQEQIDSFFDVFVTIEDNNNDISDLQSQIDALEARISALEEGLGEADNDCDGLIDEDGICSAPVPEPELEPQPESDPEPEATSTPPII